MREYNEEKHKMTMEIMALAYAVDEQTDYCVFIDYHGHVKSVSIRIMKSAKDYNSEVASSDFYTSERHDEGELGYYKAKRDHLKQILEDGEIDYGAMEHVVTEVYNHYF